MESLSKVMTRREKKRTGGREREGTNFRIAPAHLGDNYSFYEQQEDPAFTTTKEKSDRT